MCETYCVLKTGCYGVLVSMAASDPSGIVAVPNGYFCSHHFFALRLIHVCLPAKSPGLPARPFRRTTASSVYDESTYEHQGGVVLASPRTMTREEALARIVDERQQIALGEEIGYNRVEGVEKNRDWCVQIPTSLSSVYPISSLMFIIVLV